MKNIKLIVVGIAAFLLSDTGMGQSQEETVVQSDKIEVSATLSGMAFVTSDLEGTIEFYTEYLGFKEYKRMVIDSEVGLAPFGVSLGAKLNYVSLLPNVWSRENPIYPGLNFIEIMDAESSMSKQDAQRSPILGEVMKAYSVKGLVEIDKRMREAGVPIITPLVPSATGKSMTLCVIDPNGVRVQLYEFIKKK